MNKKISCGVIILQQNEIGDWEILTCHATMSKYWSIPKGEMEPGENYKDTAIRETFEETGIKLNGERILTYGKFNYNEFKDLIIFIYPTNKNEIDIKKLNCTSYYNFNYTTKDGTNKTAKKPEVDRYIFSTIDEFKNLANRKLAEIVEKVMNS
jgi:predicted NUDIX family NTP pyrophosphohydrolase